MMLKGRFEGRVKFGLMRSVFLPAKRIPAPRNSGTGNQARLAVEQSLLGLTVRTGAKMERIIFLFRWDGRIRGGQFLVWTFGVSFLSTLASMALVQAFIPRDPISGGWPADTKFWTVWSAGQLPGWIAIASLVARRLHDLGRSAIWLLPALAYAAVVKLATLAWPDFYNSPLALAISLPWLAAVIWLIAAPGEPQENRYGAPPTS